MFEAFATPSMPHVLGEKPLPVSRRRFGSCEECRSRLHVFFIARFLLRIIGMVRSAPQTFGDEADKTRSSLLRHKERHEKQVYHEVGQDFHGICDVKKGQHSKDEKGLSPRKQHKTTRGVLG